MKTKIDKLSFCLSLVAKFSLLTTLGIFGILIGFIFYKGILHFSPSLFEWEYNSQNISMLPALINTLNMVAFSIFLTTPIGVFGAIFLNEYNSKKNKLLYVIKIASDTLLGIPSIVYGLFGYLAFVIYFGFKISFLSGVLTLSLMILPLILRNSQEALKSVPIELREASLALGAGKLRTIFIVILPASIPMILAGILLSIGRVVGESAALLYTSGGVAKIAGLTDSGRTLSVHMYIISSEGQYINEAYTTAMVLIVIVLVINLLANYIAKRLTKG
ncbi:phosphate ABC transporter permease PstA [Helicobacter apodemus]|uniref:Phosphate transport system permease protein PstA n=1 Tax=Helicobacter apodemus TaxID=135569 RepID=A0A2U8FEY5_9HELI|nr:phosphate ABC transporter permease PstA [Helicobacter apodemus]AWI34713.1 phosphate ABC transporter, permease protein PstA [Helicobacter apodemus]